jgi:hypothetical protein
LIHQPRETERNEGKSRIRQTWSFAAIGGRPDA